MKRARLFLTALLLALAVFSLPAFVLGDDVVVTDTPVEEVSVSDVATDPVEPTEPVADQSDQGAEPSDEAEPASPEAPAEETPASPEEQPQGSTGDIEEPVDEPTDEPADEPAPEAELDEQSLASVTYRAHCQTYGWRPWVSDGATAGTTGQAKRVEALEIKVNGNGVTGGIQYRAHCQSYGWMAWQKDGALAGTTGKSKRVEAIQIKLTGNLAARYDVVYRVHVQGIGWMDWVENGAVAGTTGQSRRIEAVEIKLVAKSPSVSYNLHVQSIGWQGYVKGSATAGTTGQAKRVEALRIKVDTSDVAGGVQYRAYVQADGWQGWKKDGAIAGTTGQSKRVEAVQIKLTGEMAEQYDVYYRVYVQKIGWMGWAKNGESAGSTQLDLRIEALQVRIVRKGKTAPSNSDSAVTDAYVTMPTGVSYRMADTNGTWYSWQKNGATSGKTDGTRSDLLQVKLSGSSAAGSITVQGHVQGVGWADPVEGGGTVGIAGRRLEGVRITLSGALASVCDVWYRVYVRGMGWLGWATNGQSAGTQGQSRSIGGIQVKLVPKGSEAPGPTERHFQQDTYVYIDAGHGLGSSYDNVIDQGASGNGYLEYQLTMELAEMVGEYCQSEYGLNVYVNTNCNVHYKKRQADAANRGCTCFLSIHFNWWSDPAATGTETFIHSLRPPYGSAEFREYIHPRLVAATGLRDRGRLSEEFAVCGGTVPSTLCEVCFISNPADMRAYQKNKDKVARALAEGLYEASLNGF